jgi:hypothetical protein
MTGPGEKNPNYRHGTYCTKHLCACGRERDYRAKECSRCARRGYSKGGEPLVSDEAVVDAVKRNDTFKKAAASLQVSRQTVTRAAERLGLDTSHFRHGRGRPYSHEELFREGATRRLAIRERFKALNNVSYVCSACGIGPEWNGLPLLLEADHVNGNKTDNRVNNLRWLCPNCHTQQPTSKGKNYHKYGNKRLNMAEKKELVAEEGGKL